jgi:2-oxoglutarate dehydrogenase E2 component (dihydrolipoamide succinyltransferase)
MKVEIKIPPMGESISEATISQIIKQSGSAVKMDDEVVELETDKVNQVLFAPQTGTITLNVSKDTVVKIGQVIGYVDTDAKPQISAETPKSNSSEEQKKEPLASKQERPKPLIPSFPSAGKKETESSARKTKDSFLAEVQNTKKIEKPSREETTSQQVKKEISEPAQSDGRETRKKMSKIRRVIASRLVEAQHNAAMLTTFNEVDMSQIISIREKDKEAFQKTHGVKLGFMSFFVKAVVSALQKFPDLNSYIDGEDIVHRDYYDIGVAVGTDRGLFVPVIRNCDELTFAGIEMEIEKLALKARDGSLAVNDLQGGGFTITNGGIYGSLLSTPILNPPQSGILGMHNIQKRAVVIEDQIVIRPMMYLAMSYDHRIVDGKTAVSFLVHIKNTLEDSARLYLEI